MEKMIWEKPEMNENVFPANAYCNACGDSGTNYLFTCDAGGGEHGYVWTETTGDDWDSLSNGSGLDTTTTSVGTVANPSWGDLSSGLDQLIPVIGGTDWTQYDAVLSEGGYHACKTSHVASSDSAFLKGYYLANSKWNNGNFNIADVLKVIIWRGIDGNNVHCTTKLNMENWETAKS